jgi:hypothetical protein
VLFRYARFLFIQEGEDRILVQEYHGIGTEAFNKLYELLEEARLRYLSGRFTNAITSLMPILDLISTLISER